MKTLFTKFRDFWINKEWIIYLLLLLVVITVCLLAFPKSDRATIKWAQTVSAEEIDYIVLNPISSSVCRFYSDEAIETVVELINQASGKKHPTYAPYGTENSSLSLSFYLKSGKIHSVYNLDNTYLRIDGHMYKAPAEWLSSWYDVLNEDFLKSQSKPLKFIDLYDSSEEIDQSLSHNYELPDFPGVTFVYESNQLSVINQGVESVLISDAVIQNIYFWDLTRDGARDLCATVRDDSEIADTYIVVIDYDRSNTYTLRDSGKSDYFIRSGDGYLYGEQWTYSPDEHPHRELIARGNLVYKQNLFGTPCVRIQSSVNNP